jgi:hypothetical protein
MSVPQVYIRLMNPSGGRGDARPLDARAAELLVAALVLASPSAWDAVEAAALTPRLASSAIAHGVEGWVRKRARAVSVTVPGVEEAVRAALARHQRALADLDAVKAALDGAGIDFLVAKGPALVDRFYPSPDLRSYVDLDLVVSPHAVGDAVRALEAQGCQVVDANWPLLEQLEIQELRLLGPTGGAIDLHWSLGRRPLRCDPTPAFPVLLARSVWAGSGRGYRTLGWADCVVHLALHAAESGGDRLIWCADLRAAMSHADAEPAALVARAGEWGARPAVYLMLHRMSRTLGVSLPDPLLRSLAAGDPGWAALVRAVEFVWPAARADGGRSVPRIVARSARPSGAASWRALASKSLRAVSPLEPRGQGDWLLDPDDPRSALHAVGGDRARDAFFAAVSLGATAAGR